MRGSGTQLVLVAVVIGTAGYAVLLITANSLSPADNARFLVFWGVLFAVYGTLIGTTTEGTRSVFSATAKALPIEASSQRQHRAGALVVPVGAGIGIVMMLTLLLTGLLWAPRVLGEAWKEQLLLLAIGSALFGIHSSLAGVLAGRRDLTAYSALVVNEILTRLVLVIGVAFAGFGLGGYAAASSLAAGSWLLLCLSWPTFRGAWRVRGDVDLRGQILRNLAAMAASGASAVLMVGFPLLVRVTSSDAVLAGAAPLMLAVSLTRAPLLVPLGAYQNLVVTQVGARGWSALRVPMALIAGAVVVGAAFAFAFGPWALDLVRDGYTIERWTFAGLLVAAGLAAIITLTGAATIAMSRHRAYLLGWAVATVVVLGLLALPLDLEVRTVLALIVGPAVGAAIHVGGHLKLR